MEKKGKREEMTRAQFQKNVLWSCNTESDIGPSYNEWNFREDK